MKNIFLKSLIIAVLFAAGISLLAFNTIEDIKKNYAVVNQQNGLYIFSDCMPLKPYTFLGEVKSSTGGFGSAQYTNVKLRLLKNAKKKYPQADGIILRLTTGAADRADVIKFD